MKKKIAYINVVCNGSTGKIVRDLATYAKQNEYDVTCIYGQGKSQNNINAIKFNSRFDFYFHLLLARLGFNGHGSFFATKRIVKYLQNENPDIIHIHNVHGYWINLKILFNYLKNEYKGKIIWTLHDCWAFTGHCSYFTTAHCTKWQDHCYNCPMLNSYPKELFDTTRREFDFKKELFTGLNRLILTTPSDWLKGLVKKSFLKKYTIKTVKNGIDLKIFKPTNSKDVYSKYCIPANKKIIIGVANIWEERKGLKVFLELSKLIVNNIQIVLIGLTKNQISRLPSNIIGIQRTDNTRDLVGLYSIADVFVNPSLEETFSLVTVEAMACGIPVIVSKTSAIKDLVTKGTGYVVKNETIDDYYSLINEVLKRGKKSFKSSLKSEIKKYDSKKMILDYLKIYGEKNENIVDNK